MLLGWVRGEHRLRREQGLRLCCQELLPLQGCSGAFHNRGKEGTECGALGVGLTPCLSPVPVLLLAEGTVSAVGTAGSGGAQVCSIPCAPSHLRSAAMVNLDPRLICVRLAGLQLHPGPHRWLCLLSPL